MAPEKVNKTEDQEFTDFLNSYLKAQKEYEDTLAEIAKLNTKNESDINPKFTLEGKGSSEIGEYKSALERIDKLLFEEINKKEETDEEESVNQITNDATNEDLDKLLVNINEEFKNEKVLSQQNEGSVRQKLTLIKDFYLNNKWSKRFKKVVLWTSLSMTALTSAALTKYSPQELSMMYKNYKERHIDKAGKDDPTIKGLNELFNDSTDVERTTFDYLGTEKIDYLGGYYVSSVFDLSDRTPPRFKVLNGREDLSSLDSIAGITTNVFKKFQDYNDFVPELKGHTGKKSEARGLIPVIGFNKKTNAMKAGHYSEFNEDWLVSETYEIQLSFTKDSNGEIPLMYHDQVERMVPFTTNEKGKKIPFPIGVTHNEKINSIKPESCTHFGTLEGGKVIMVCGDKQLQVNGSFADMYMVYERLTREYPKTPIQGYLLDNGSYNLPIWDKDSTLTQDEIKNHLYRNKDGGTALALIDDGSISPYEYVNKYKELAHYSPNFTRDTKTGKPAMNEKTLVVIHHTGNYNNPNDIIKEFEDTTKEVSAHVLIMKDGTRHVFNNDNYVMAHAGKSDWNGRNAANYFSLGIEIEGEPGYANNPDQFTMAQIESMLEYLRPRLKKYNIPFESITTHKVIRDAYMKKHPEDKDVKDKIDLNEKVFKQLQEIMKKKLYKDAKTVSGKDTLILASIGARDMWKKTHDKNATMMAVNKMLKTYVVTPEDIKKAEGIIEEKLG